MEAKEIQNNIALSILLDNRSYEFRNIALNEKVRESGLIAYDSYSARSTIVEYVNKYGYEAMDAFVKMFGDELEKRGVSEDD